MVLQVGSRVVVQVAGCIMMFTALLGKFGALFATIPEPVIGGVLCVSFGKFKLTCFHKYFEENSLISDKSLYEKLSNFEMYYRLIAFQTFDCC